MIIDALRPVLPLAGWSEDRVRSVEVTGALEVEARQRRRREVGGAADQPRVVLRESVEHLLRCLATREALRVRFGTVMFASC